MKKNKSYWRKIAKAFLEAGNFNPNGYCHVKFKALGSSHYTRFGVVSATDKLRVQLLTEFSKLSGESICFTSVDAMLDAGWDVD